MIAFLVTTLAKNLCSIFLKILLNSENEKTLADFMFKIAQNFADKTPNKTDDKIVSWAKSMYENSDHLNEQVQKIVNENISGATANA